MPKSRTQPRRLLKQTKSQPSWTSCLMPETVTSTSHLSCVVYVSEFASSQNWLKPLIFSLLLSTIPLYLPISLPNSCCLHRCMMYSPISIFAFRMMHSRGEMYIDTAVCLSFCVCLSVPCHTFTLLHTPECNFGDGSECPLVVHSWSDLQLVHRFRCCDSIHVCIQYYSWWCIANAYQSTLMLLGQLSVNFFLSLSLYSQLPVKFDIAFHRMRNVSECTCTSCVAGYVMLSCQLC